MLGPVCYPSKEIETPTSTHEVVSIVKSAFPIGLLKVKAFTGHHAVTNIICTAGIPIDMSQFKEPLYFNDSDYTVTVSAGYTLRELGTFLHSKGRAYHGSPGNGGLTIAGVLSTESVGSSLKYDTSISSQTIGVKIVDGHGNVEMISSEKQMRAYRCHLGMLGIILEATISTVRDYKIQILNERLAEDFLTTGEWERVARKSDFVRFTWHPSSKSVVVTTGTIVPVSTPGNASSNSIPTTTADFNAALKYGLAVLQQANFHIGMRSAESFYSVGFTDATNGHAPYLTEDGTTMVNPGTGYAYLMQNSVCGNSCLWNHAPNDVTALKNSVALDLKDFSKVIQTVKEILYVSNATFALGGISLIFGRSSSSYLSVNNGRETFSFEFNVVRRLDLYETASSGISAYQAIMQALVFTYDGRPRWGKNGLWYISREVIQQKVTVKNLGAFLAERMDADPNAINMNDFGRRLLNTEDKIDTDPRTTHCALQDNCLCKRDRDCARYQICTHLYGFPYYSVCQNKAETMSYSNDSKYPKPINQYHES